MLLQMRNFARSPLAYVLLLVLVVAFAIWGVNDVFRGAGAQHLAKVGAYEITPAQLSRELQLTLRGQRAQGVNMTQQEAIDAGLHNRLLEGMIGRYSLYAWADKIGVAASDAMVAERIRAIPNVLNPVTGQFDRIAYDAFLRELGYNRTEFERDVRGDMTNQMLLGALTAGVRAPSSYGALALAFESEVRTVSIAEAPAAAIGAIAPPSEEQLQAFYDENREALRTPEYRALTLVIARPEDFISRVEVSPARLNEEVAARAAAGAEPERRSYFRIAAQNEADANAAAQRIGAGEAPDAVARALGLQFSRGENHAREDVADPNVAEAVFAMPAGAAPRVVAGRLSPFVVVGVTGIAAPPAQDTSALREQVRRQIALEEAAEMLHDAIGAYEDERASGASVRESAERHGLPVISLAPVDARGRDQSGQPVAALAAFAEPLRAAFATPEGEATDFLPADDADAVVFVDRIIPASVRPLDAVREELRAAWIGRERGQRMRALGEAVVNAVAAGTSFAQAARTHGMRVVVSSQRINRQAVQQIPARALGGMIFQAREGDAVSDIRADGGAVLAAIVERIERIEPGEAPQLVEAAREQIVGALQESLASAVQSDVVERMHPRRNPRLLASTFTPSAETDENQ